MICKKQSCNGSRREEIARRVEVRHRYHDVRIVYSSPGQSGSRYTSSHEGHRQDGVREHGRWKFDDQGTVKGVPILSKGLPRKEQGTTVKCGSYVIPDINYRIDMYFSFH